ncbi:hypothetical protein [Streptomyces griseomycini]|uniref:Uncharacterized protein n=1 Tax=Streptomyces griseomycini TaxID=66895 RepID=A0A7W7LVE0_9ACTN|nr:hypothetical protein [Streptomyces griseomycini]MBB4896416.1 hypothetical protein [Streptomyces griseomycini]GGP84209.1 hypothetical protein GCM10010266_02690 [Streptomyces griseomycini]GGR02539.1 hypothetical protein GCM10015536_04270 [Streptomyces griseomycini]
MSADGDGGPCRRDRRSVWADAVRGSWTALCAAAAVVLGPAAHTESTLVRANAAPLHRVLPRGRGPAH